MPEPELVPELDGMKLIVSLSLTRGEDGFSNEEGDVVLDWAQRTRLNQLLLDMVLGNRIRINVKDGEVAFWCPKE